MNAALVAPADYVIAGEPKPSCRTCRRSSYDSRADALRCNEVRSPARPGGLVAINITGLKKAGAYEEKCQTVAARCKFYQEGG